MSPNLSSGRDAIYGPICAFTVNKVPFIMTLIPNEYEERVKQYNVEFAQAEGKMSNHEDWVSRNHQDFSLMDTIAVFATIDAALTFKLDELEESGENIELLMHPMDMKLKKNSGTSRGTDAPRMNSYQMMFPHSKLHAMGYEMEVDSDRLKITRYPSNRKRKVV